tara:strand:- start:8 stop:172 length:165 start_codon:yes stop_codon:yes gene_type:complete
MFFRSLPFSASPAKGFPERGGTSVSSSADKNGEASSNKVRRNSFAKEYQKGTNL